MRDGTYVNWKINGLQLYIMTILGYAALAHYGHINGSLLADNFVPLLVHANIIAFTISAALFIKGRLANSTSGNALMDMWAGSEFNPQFLGLPVKFFMLKPAMMGWTMMNLSFLYRSIAQNNGEVPLPMLQYQILSFLYVLDYFYLEENMTSTWDIIAEK